MLITITSDASFDTHSNKAGYAFLISCNAGKFSKSGSLDTAKNITEAELMAIANSLHYIVNHKELWGVSKVIFNVDFIAAEDFIFKPGGTTMSKKKVAGKRYRQIVGKITSYIGLLRKEYKGVQFEFRHVKAHTKDESQRSKANKFVDKLAVEARKNK